MNTFVFYHNDMDGECAAHVINSYDDWPTPSASMRAINYGMDFPFDEIGEGDRVYILDYSIEPEEMRRLLDITEDVIWCDHHKTAIEKYANSQHIQDLYGLTEIHIPGVRTLAWAGCVATYMYVSQTYPHVSREIPHYIKLVGDRDTWKFEYGDKTRLFFAGMQAEDTVPRAPIWDSLRWDADYGTLNEMLSNGRIIQEYKNKTRQQVVRENGFWVEFRGHKCYAVNGGRGSEPFEAVVPDAEIWIAFSYMPGGFWAVSLYSDKVDVSEIAQQYEYEGKRGGGHPGASGFQCAFPPFLNSPGANNG